MDTKILNQIEEKFSFPPENWERLIDLWKNDQPISFISWECPPRQIKEDKKNGRWVNFDIDINSVVEGKKLDKYTELPRMTTQHGKEKWFIKNIILKNPNTTYTKIVADTNAVYLFIKSRKILGDKKIRYLSEKFRGLLIKKGKILLRKYLPPVKLYTDFQKKFVKDYEMFFNFIYKSFLKDKSELVSSDILDAWKDCMINHIGMTKKDKIEQLNVMKRVIASYAAEGMVFEILNRSKILPNPVWVNWEEIPNMAKTTNILRLRYGIEPMPIIYFVQK